MEKVQKREGLVCICAECKKVIRLVGSVTAGVTPIVSHGICPVCADKLYGHLFRRGVNPPGSRPPAAAAGD
jgi:hypothetical protein